MPRVRSIDECEFECMHASSKWIASAGGNVSGIFSGDNAGYQSCTLKAGSLRHSVPVVSPEALGSLPPSGGVSRRSSARWVGHAQTGAKSGCRDGRRVQECLAHVVVELVNGVKSRVESGRSLDGPAVGCHRRRRGIRLALLLGTSVRRRVWKELRGLLSARRDWQCKQREKRDRNYVFHIDPPG